MYFHDQTDLVIITANYDTSEMPTFSSTEHPTIQISVPCTHEGDLEDAMAKEMPHNQITSDIIIVGQKTTKAKALCH